MVDRIGDEEARLRQHKARLVKAGRMYAMCRKAQMANPLQLVAVALAAFEEMPLKEALAFIRVERENLEDLAWAFTHSESPGEFEEKLKEARGL